MFSLSVVKKGILKSPFFFLGVKIRKHKKLQINIPGNPPYQHGVKKASKKLQMGSEKVAKSCIKSTQKRLRGVSKPPFFRWSKKRVL
jgi:hypothetical protein